MKESAMFDEAEKSVEAMMVTAEAVMAQTRETVEAITVSALLQARMRQFDFLESVKFFEKVYADLPVETRIMSGLWMDTMMTPKGVLRSMFTT